MKLSRKQKAAIKSYARALFAAWSALVVNGVQDWQGYAWAAVLAIIPPMLRAVDKNDNAFGAVADAIQDVAEQKVSESQTGKPAKPKRVKKDA